VPTFRNRSPTRYRPHLHTPWWRPKKIDRRGTWETGHHRPRQRRHAVLTSVRPAEPVQCGHEPEDRFAALVSKFVGSPGSHSPVSRDDVGLARRH